MEGGKLAVQRLVKEDCLKYCDIPISTSHPGSLIINDPAPHMPSQKLPHDACTNPPTFEVDPQVEQYERIQSMA